MAVQVALSPPTVERVGVVPYIASWSEEATLPAMVIETPCGIGFADETTADRDRFGALWERTTFAPGHGRPRFKTVHPMRQRRAMHRLLCQVCAHPADSADDGVLWLLRDHRDDWAGWPERMATTDPPVCVPCARTAVRLCPALRTGHVAIRARHAPICGVRGKLYRATRTRPIPTGADVIRYDDPALRWTVASQLLRELHHCTIIDLDDLEVATCG